MKTEQPRRIARQRARRFGVLTAAVSVLVTLVAIAAPQSVHATGGFNIFYSWGQGTNTVSRISNTTPTNTWASGSTGSGAAKSVTTDGTYIYWANGTKIFRQSASAAAGATATPFIDIAPWESNFPFTRIDAIAVDANHIYIGAWRNIDDNSIIRADKTNGTRDTSWAKMGFGTSSYPVSSIATDNSASGYVIYSWVNYLGRASKSSVGTGPSPATPTVDEQTWLVPGAGMATSSDPTPLVTDGTYVYYRDGNEQVARKSLTASAGGPGTGTVVTQHIPGSSPSDYSGKITGLAYDSATDKIYATSSVASGNTYTIYKSTPDPTSQTVIDSTQPGYFSSHATFTSTSSSLTSLVLLPIPASAPVISTQPSAISKTVGQSATFTVTATVPDGGTLSYQWRKDGTPISGATSSTYTIASTVSGDAGTYSVVVTNTLGSTTATTTSSSAALTVSAATANNPVSSTPAAPTLVTSSNQSLLTAEPGQAVAIINGAAVAVETVKAEVNASPEEQLAAAKKIVNEIASVIPAGGKNPIAVVNTGDGAEISGLMVNPDDPSEKLNMPVESVTLVKAGDSRVLISALNQTNLPAEIASGGVLQVTRGGVIAARAYGLPGAATGEIVLMSTPRLLKTFTVEANGSYSGQVPLPKDISFGTHTVVMATANAKVSLGIKLVRTRMQFRVKRSIGTTIFKNRAGVVKRGGGKITITSSGRCKANSTKVTMSSKPGACYVTVRQAAKGRNKAIFYRFTVSVVKKLPKRTSTR